MTATNARSRNRRPLVAVTACVKSINDAPFHSVEDKYLHAVSAGAQATPIVLPAIGAAVDIDELCARFDGFVFTGSLSNVEPSHYAGTPSRAGTAHDPQRDATTLPLLRRLIAADAPVLALCRGMQELNVACGGTLHQHVHELPGKLDHRAPPSTLPRAVRYAPEHHRVRLQPGGLLADLTGLDSIMVNSLHEQAIDRLGAGLEVEATAPDGLIEAVRFAGKRFVLGVQWHPEACVDFDAPSRAIFAGFGRHLRTR